MSGLVGPIVKWMGERRALLIGLLFAGIGFVLYGVAWTTVGFLGAILVNSLWALAGPTSQSLMTRRVSASVQGELQGAIASLRGVAMLIGPGIFSLTFAYFIAPEHGLPGAPWYLAGALLFISFLIAWAVTADKGGFVGELAEVAGEPDAT
jgi:DHA1 family tetracycline resistance protein-like MFS transporter